MRKFLLLPVFCLTVLATSCSTDDSVQMNENNITNVQLKTLCMELTGTQGLNAGVWNPKPTKLHFFWNNTTLVEDTDPSMMYQSFIQIRNIGCDNTSTSVETISVDLFHQLGHTIDLNVRPELYGCFEWRLVVQKYHNLSVLQCETATNWAYFNN